MKNSRGSLCNAECVALLGQLYRYGGSGGVDKE